MPSASAGVSELLLAKLDALLAKFDTVAARSYPLETEFGINRKYTKPLKSFAERCCGLGSYRLAEDNLRELVAFRFLTSPSATSPLPLPMR